MTFESSRWMFRMMNRPHLNMIEVSELISPPHSPQLTAQLTFGPQMTLKCLDDDRTMMMVIYPCKQDDAQDL